MRDEPKHPRDPADQGMGKRMEPEPGDEIARQLGRGSPEALETVRRRIRAILSYRGYGMTAEDRHDLEQEVMTQIWQAVNRAGFATDRFWGFVEVVTTRRSIDWLRRRRTDRPLDEALPARERGPLAAVLARERTELGHAVLAQLAKPCRDLIYLHFAMRKPYRELSDLLGKSEGALRVQLHRCVAEARRILAEQHTDARPNASSTRGR